VRDLRGGRRSARLALTSTLPSRNQGCDHAASGSPNKLLGYVFGVVYLLVGAAGFAVTGGVGFAATEGEPLIVFDVNPLHNIIHLLVGAVLVLAATRGARAAKGMNTLVGAVYLVLGIIGLFILDSSLNVLALNAADNVLHLGSALLLLGVGLSQDKGRTTAAA